MGGAAQKPASPHACACGASSRPLAGHEKSPRTPSPNIRAELVTMETDADVQRGQLGPQVCVPTAASPSALLTRSEASTPARPHLAPSRSPMPFPRRSETSSTQRTPSRHAARRPMLPPILATLSNESAPHIASVRAIASADPTAPITATTATANAAPSSSSSSPTKKKLGSTLALPVAAASPASPDSSCSAFSLYSADSSLRDIPVLPSHPQTTEAISSAALPSSHPALPALALVENAWLGARLHTAASGGLPPAVVLPVSSPTPVTHGDAVTDSTQQKQQRSPRAASQPASTTLAALQPGSHHHVSVPASPIIAPSYANFLLDMSFDSRSLTMSAAITTAEIQRIGTRLQKYQRGPCASSPPHPSSSAEAAANPSQRCDPARTSSVCVSPTQSTQKTETPVPLLEPLVSTTPVEEGTSAFMVETREPASAAEAPYYRETLRFVEVIQQLQRARDAERMSYTWFRRDAVQANPATATSSTASNVIGMHKGSGIEVVKETEEEHAGGPTRSSSCANAQSLLTETSRALHSAEEEDDEEDRDATDSEAGRRASMRRRDRLLTLVHWTPYETYECDPMTPGNLTATCLCGFPTPTSPFGLDRCSAFTPQLSQDIGVNGSVGHDSPMSVSPLRHRRDGTKNDDVARQETPPLPTVLALVNTAAATVAPASEAGKSSSAGTESGGPVFISSSATFAPSPSFDNPSHCPVHVAFRPTSIFIMHHSERSRTTADRSSPATRQQLVSGQVEVPASAVSTPRPSAAPLPVIAAEKRMDGRWSDLNMNSSHSSSSVAGASISVGLGGSGGSDSGSARRAIIDGDVPHRQQLAKKASEDNKLFFESILRRQKASQPRAEGTSPTAL